MVQWRKWFGRQAAQETELASDNIPRHIAVIMDGNGRWAKRKGLPRAAGHHAGMKNVKHIALAAGELGVEVLTLYAFSTENWKRPKDEVDFLMNLPQEFFPQEIEELIQNNIQIRMMGSKDHLPAHTLNPILDAIERTKSNSGMVLNFALNYGSRHELLIAMRRFMEDMEAGKHSLDDLDETRFEAYLQSAELPDPDLLIRTSGELRISNFMLWQLAYTELWFTDAYWPDFKKAHFFEAIRHYQLRKRRFGGL